jgi:hypothetical protein
VNLGRIITTALLTASVTVSAFAERKTVPVHVYYDQYVAHHYCGAKVECPALDGYVDRVIANAQQAWDRTTKRDEEFQVTARTFKFAAENNDAEYHVSTIALDNRRKSGELNVYLMGQPFAAYNDGDQKSIEGFTFGDSIFLLRTLQIAPRRTYVDEQDDMDTFLHEGGHNLGGVEIPQLYGKDVPAKFRTTYASNSSPDFYLDFGNEYLINHSDLHDPMMQKFTAAKEKFPDLPELIEVLKHTQSAKNPHYIKAKQRLLKDVGDRRKDIEGFLLFYEHLDIKHTTLPVNYALIGKEYVQADRAFREGQYATAQKFLDAALASAKNADADIQRVLQAAQFALFEKLGAQPPCFPVAYIPFVIDNCNK